MKQNRVKSTNTTLLRDRILDTAMQAFVTKGIKAVKMDDIAKMLGISKRTLYETYGNKEILLFEGVKKYHAISEEKLAYIYNSTSDVMDILLKIYRLKVEESKNVCTEFYSDLAKYPSVEDYLSKGRKQANENFVAFLKRGVEEGYFRKDLNLELVCSAFSSTMLHIVRDELYKFYSIEEIFHNIVFVSFRGFSTLEGIKRLDEY